MKEENKYPEKGRMQREKRNEKTRIKILLALEVPTRYSTLRATGGGPIGPLSARDQRGGEPKSRYKID